MDNKKIFSMSVAKVSRRRIDKVRRLDFTLDFGANLGYDISTKVSDAI